MASPLQSLRERRGLTRRQLADATGIPLRSIAAYEAGVEMPLGRAVTLAAALDVSLSDFAASNSPAVQR